MQKLDPVVTQRLAHRLFDLGFRDMQGADAVPVCGMGAEVGLCRHLALGL